MKKTFTLMAMTILLFLSRVTTTGPVDKSKALQMAQNFWNSCSQGNTALTQVALEQVTLSWDGYDENDFFHINWGWNGLYNGF